jgi:hypothetical protein
MLFLRYLNLVILKDDTLGPFLGHFYRFLSLWHILAIFIDLNVKNYKF